jgi:hypothetical protein
VSHRSFAPLDCPVINTGVHVQSHPPDLEDYIASYGCSRLVDELRAAQRAPGTPNRCGPVGAERCCQTLAEQGSDHAILLPDEMFVALAVHDRVQRGTLLRAVNHYHADLWRKHRARVTPAAGISLGTAGEGIAQLEFAVKRLSFKAVSIARCALHAPGGPALARAHPLDAFWARALELGVPVLVDHAPATASDASSAPALSVAEVTRRFPGLRFGLLDRRRPSELGEAQLFVGFDWADYDVLAGLPAGASTNAIYSSDPFHRAIPGLAPSLGEGRRLVEQGLIGEDDFNACVFANPYTLCTAANPDFFKGTTVEDKLRRGGARVDDRKDAVAA